MSNEGGSASPVRHRYHGDASRRSLKAGLKTRLYKASGSVAAHLLLRVEPAAEAVMRKSVATTLEN